MSPKKNQLAVRQSNRTLPEIIAEAQMIVKALAESGGELTPELEQLVDFNQAALSTKLDRYAFIDEKLQAESNFWKAKADHYRQIARGCEAMRERLRANIKTGMQALEITELKGLESRYVLVNGGQKLVIDDPEQLPAAFIMQITSTALDKEKITDALKAGFEVTGAKLETITALRAYENNERE